METDVQQKPPWASWGKRIGIILGLLVLLLVVAYFVGTSSAFIKGIVLPRVSNAINAKVTVDEISLSPFSSADIHGLRVQTTGSEPLLTATEVRLRYGLIDIIKGNIHVDEVTLDGPTISIVQQADGTSNLDPLLKGGKAGEKKSPSKEPTKLAINNVSLKNGTLRQVVNGKDGSVNRTEIQGLNVSLDHLGNGQSGKLTLASSFQVRQTHGQTNNLLAGNISGGYDLALNQQLLPQSVKGSTKLTVSQAEGSYKDLGSLSGSLDADLTPKEIRQVALRFFKGDQQLGRLQVSGPLDLEKREGDLKIEILSLDKNTLSLALAGRGFDLGNSVLNSTNQVTISQSGSFFSAKGNLSGSRLSFRQAEMVTPEINLNLDYQTTVNTTEKSAVLQRVNVTGQSSGKTFLTTDLDRPMNLSWGQAVQGYKDASLGVVLTNFNLAEWKAVIGTNLNSGVVSATVSLTSQQDGQLLKTSIAAQIEGLNARFGSNSLENAAATFQGNGTVEKLKIVDLPRYALTLRQNNDEVVNATGAARYSLDSKEATAEVTANAILARVLKFANVPEARAQNGSARITASYRDSGGKRAAVGSVGLADFTGGYGNYSFTNFTVGLDYNVAIQGQDVNISQATLSVKQGVNTGGTVDVKGTYNLESKAGKISYTAVGLNQNAFAPILASSLGENQLVSISLNSSGDAALDPKGETAIKTQMKISNWVVRDKAGKLPKTPLSVELNLDGGMRQQVLDLRQLVVQLTPNERAKNALQLQGKLDMSKTNPSPSTITLRSESFDVTPYYNMFAGGKTNTSANAPTSTSAPQNTTTAAVPAGEAKEPPTMNLPFQQLTADLKIDRFYLREVAISNWTGTVAMGSNVIQVNPFKLQLNGGAVNLTANVDVGRPGYVYDLGFNADSVPLAPLANSFGSSTNKLQGNFIGQVQIHGAGVTGPNLKKNLGGDASVNLTNLNYQVVGPRLRNILVPISLALQVPELTETPLNWVAAQTEITNGVVNLKHLGVESAAFYAESAGAMALADVITNSSLNLPIDLSLRRNIAEKARLLSPDTPTNAPYAKLPRFVTVKGTLGSPKTDINKLALLGTFAREAAAFGLGNQKAEQALGAVGSLLTGQPAGTNASGTNTTGNLIQGLNGLLAKQPTNAASPGTNRTSGVLRELGGLLGTPKPSTNDTKTNAAPAKPAQNLFDSLLGPRK